MSITRKRASASLIAISICLMLVLGVFSFWPNGGLIDKAFVQSSPRIYVIRGEGDPAMLDSVHSDMLPPGYSYIPEEDVKHDFVYKEGDYRYMLFSLNPGFTDMGEIMKFAREHGTEEVYFVPVPRAGPDEIVPTTPLPDFTADLIASGLNWFSHLNLSELLDLVITPAFADGVCSPGLCFGGIWFPAGTCMSYDGHTNIKTCMQYGEFDVHLADLARHISRNIAYYDAGTPESFVNCMENHNGSSYIDPPALLYVDYYISSGALPSCPGSAGCAPGAPTPSATCSQGCGTLDCNCNTSLLDPLSSVSNKHIQVAQSSDLNNWGVTRHETAHQYGFGHCHIDKDLKRVGHCINGKKGGPCNPPGGQSNGPVHNVL